jgi:hypothetical protein
MNRGERTPARETMQLPRSRTVFRWIHIVFAIPILGYIYSLERNII